MLRLSKLADYAVVVLIRLADGERTAARTGLDGAVQTSPCIAAATGVPEPTVAKVLKALTCADLVVSQRGARGGYRLARSLAQISVTDVIVAVDGPIALTACVEGGAGGCEVQGVCAMKGRWEPVNDAVREALSAISLEDMRAAVIPRSPRVPADAIRVHASAAE
jgi:FeS assembly SUF system regulator